MKSSARAIYDFSCRAVHHGVQHAVLQQEFAALEALGQLLADGLLDHARAGESDQRAGFGDIQVAQHGERSGHAAGGGIGQTEMYGTLASSRRASAAEILASCIRLITPSIMRAPPEAETMMSGMRWSRWPARWRG